MSADYPLQPFAPFGPVALIHQPGWSTHATIIRRTQDLAFSTSKYPYFDRIIAENAKIPALYNHLQADFARYAGLRVNLAVLRNHLAASAIGYNPFLTGNNEKYLPRLRSMAMVLGEGIASGSINSDLANVEGVGAASLYKYLLQAQDKPGLSGMVRRLRTGRNRKFDLPGIEATPFSNSNLSMAFSPEALNIPVPEEKPHLASLAAAAVAAPPPAATTTAETGGSSDDNYRARELNMETNAAAGERMADLAEQAMITSIVLDSVDDLETETKMESVEEARKILRWLRNLQATDRDVEEWLDQGTPEAGVAKAEKLMQLVNIYTQHLQYIRRSRPELAADPAVLDAMDALRAMAIGMGEKALRLLPDGHPRLLVLDNTLDALPANWEKRSGQSVQRLLSALEGGIEKLLGKQVSELTPGEKLAMASISLNKNAQMLRGVEALRGSAREESIELAREILDTLNNSPFKDKTPQQIATTAKPEEKAAFAQKIDEGAESYRNIVAEVAKTNPNIMADKRVQEANDAVASFAQSIQQMATREMAAPVAAATVQPAAGEQFADPKGRTVASLLGSMKGGLEKAASELQRNEELKQQKQAELKGQENANTQEQDGTRKSKRMTTGKSVAVARKQVIELAADDMAIKLAQQAARGDQDKPASQRRAAPVQTPNIKLKNAADMDAIKEAGGALQSDMRGDMAMANVAPTDKIVPDDKGQASNVARVGERDPNQPKSNAAKVGTKSSNPNKRK